jgi:hypothetical protein
MSLSTQSVTSASSLFANLNLTAAQNTQVQNILTTAKSQGESPSQVNSQVSSILSPTQQATFQSDLQQAKGGHHHHHGGGGSSTSATSGLDSTTDALGVSNSATDPDSTTGADALDNLFGAITGSSTSTQAGQSTNPFSSIAANFAVQSQLQQLVQF